MRRERKIDMENIIVVGILILLIGAAVVYMVKAKKKGVKCIGCPAGGSCPHSKNQSGCSCAGHSNMKK